MLVSGVLHSVIERARIRAVHKISRDREALQVPIKGRASHRHFAHLELATAAYRYLRE